MNCGRKACDKDLFCMECGMRLSGREARREEPCLPAVSCTAKTAERKTALGKAWFVVACIGALLCFFGGIAIPVCAAGTVGAIIEYVKNKKEKCKTDPYTVWAMSVGGAGVLLSTLFLLVTLFL